MKDKQKSLEDIDFVTELSMSELEGISGGSTQLTTINENSDEGTIFGPLDLTATPKKPLPALKWGGESPR
ncbi:hypothetical protein NIES2107_11400 [Nostoc carneum NIES-2107]|nr:hypothetical protein NIES2107_11400 [Nostoc carneum NIES-2107]